MMRAFFFSFCALWYIFSQFPLSLVYPKRWDDKEIVGKITKLMFSNVLPFVKLMDNLNINSDVGQIMHIKL